jgi:hypothetical protein
MPKFEKNKIEYNQKKNFVEGPSKKGWIFFENCLNFEKLFKINK